MIGELSENIAVADVLVVIGLTHAWQEPEITMG